MSDDRQKKGDDWRNVNKTFNINIPIYAKKKRIGREPEFNTHTRFVWSQSTDCFGCYNNSNIFLPLIVVLLFCFKQYFKRSYLRQWHHWKCIREEKNIVYEDCALHPNWLGGVNNVGPKEQKKNEILFSIGCKHQTLSLE